MPLLPVFGFIKFLADGQQTTTPMDAFFKFALGSGMSLAAVWALLKIVVIWRRDLSLSNQAILKTTIDNLWAHNHQQDVKFDKQNAKIELLESQIEEASQHRSRLELHIEQCDRDRIDLQVKLTRLLKKEEEA